MILNRFPELYETGIIRFDESMRLHTSFRIGGPADIFCTPHSVYVMAELLKFAVSSQIPYLVIGKGSNLLIGDKGFRGMVISTLMLNKIVRFGTSIYAECGATLKDLCDLAQVSGLSGLEFASGIPGSVGGAVFMNAGAYNGEIKDALSKSMCLTRENSASAFPLQFVPLSNLDHLFAYRSSILSRDHLIHLYSVFELKPVPPEDIKAKMDELDAMRSSKQPLDLPSAGSIFKRPPGHFTGQLIDECNLRGHRIGGAAISDKHCGFIVNVGGATAQDVLDLIAFVSASVRDRFGVELEPEIRLIGEK
ncbi:MAG: UDP-N-acetylenolpyruvoylglucosamine reductase [Candidatus Cloacimonetes bacterium HGW-Cloacimonetes-1]|jgi:UDP-N-acetylmuramate dehydrogenase|nr:MAG: UDP-N-acetylenolpyruvoylglucosamine reductase [Candidatus Cloacimonetes bacterium HGW-Cloacimonetes-1]